VAGAVTAGPVPGRPDRPVVPTTLVRHLELWVGGWPPVRPVRIVANPRRALPGWDGEVAPVAGVVTDTGDAVLGLAPYDAARARAWLAERPPADLDALLAAVPGLIGRDGVAGRGVFRWSTDPAPLADAGVWIPADDRRVPPWLRPFGGEVLVVLDGDTYVAGVGVKRHDGFGRELSVGTEPQARGRGLARRLVAQAARRVLADGAVPTYLHAPDNVASARAATAAGFPDLGWQVLGFFPRAVTS
jgi:GNAT superfamily N-acetyltransferase